MAVKYPITLSVSEPNNNIGLLKVRQADEESQTLVVQILEDAISKSYEGLQAFFCARIGQTAGLGIIEQKLNPNEMTDPKNGKFEYTFRPEDWQILGRQTGYFSFRKMKDDHTYEQQFSTRDFTYEVTKNIYSDGIKELKKDGSTYVWTFEDLLRLLQEFKDSGETDFLAWFDEIKGQLSEDAAGNLMLLYQSLRDKTGKDSDFREFEADKSFMRRVLNESAERGVNVKWFGAKGDGQTDDTNAFEEAMEASQNVIVPAGTYVVNDLLIKSKKIQVVGQGEVVLKATQDVKPIFGASAEAYTTLPVSNVDYMQTVFNLDDTPGIEVGDLMLISSNQRTVETAFNWTRSHSALVKSVSDTSIEIDRGAICEFATGYEIALAFFKPSELTLENIKFESDGNSSVPLLDIKYTKNLKLTNVGFKTLNLDYDLADPNTNGVRIMNSVDSILNNISGENICYVVLPSNGSNGCTVTTGLAKHCRHFSAPTGTQYGFVGKNIRTFNCYTGIDSHQGSFDTFYEDVITVGDVFVTKLRGRRDTLRNVTIDGDLELVHDTPLFAGSRNLGIIEKNLSNVRINGNVKGIVKSIKIDTFSGHGKFMFSAPAEQYRIENAIFKNVTMQSGEYDVIADRKIAFWLGQANRLIVENLTLVGPVSPDVAKTAMDSQNVSAIYSDRDPLASNLLTNVLIRGFSRAIDLHGSRDMSQITLKDCRIENCSIGIDTRATYCDNATLENFSFSGNYQNAVDDFNFRFRNLTATASNTALLPRIMYGTSIPVTGTFRPGDRVFNINPSNGIIEWICTAAGSPGTWVQKNI